MKVEILSKLRLFEEDLRSLRKDVKAIQIKTINVKDLRDRAEGLATRWVEELRSPLEHKFKIDSAIISHTSEDMKRLHVLSRPSNLKTSYVETLDSALNKFKDRFILPIQQMSIEV